MFVSKRSWCLKLIDFGHAKLINNNGRISGNGESTPKATPPLPQKPSANKTIPIIPPFRSKSAVSKTAAFNAIGGRFAEWTAPEIFQQYGLGGSNSGLIKPTEVF